METLTDLSETPFLKSVLNPRRILEDEGSLLDFSSPGKEKANKQLHLPVAQGPGGRIYPSLGYTVWGLAMPALTALLRTFMVTDTTHCTSSLVSGAMLSACAQWNVK